MDQDEPKQASFCFVSSILLLTFPCQSRYSTFVRIGTGLSFADYAWIRDKPWKKWDPKDPPEWLQTSKRGIEDKADVYLDPHEWAVSEICWGDKQRGNSSLQRSSFLIKVKAAEVVATGEYCQMGYSAFWLPMQSNIKCWTCRPISLGIHNALPSSINDKGRPVDCRLYECEWWVPSRLPNELNWLIRAM